MEYIIGIAIIVAAAVVLAGLYAFRPAGSGVSAESIAMLQREVQGLAQTVNTQLGATNAQMFEQLRVQFTESQRLATDIRDAVKGQLTEVATRVGETKEATQKVFGIADQLNHLRQILTSQKQRGNLGEAGLALILQNILPPTDYALQYQFQNGDRVDAAIKAPEGIIPIDAKFPLENYMRILDEPDQTKRANFEAAFKGDLKARIDETAKYVRPSEGTVDFAFMFIPAEAIYYDLLVNEVGAVKVNTRNLIDYAFNTRKVVIVSPTTFAAYLQTVLQGFRAFKIERDAREIARNVENLARHLKAYEEFFHKVGASLATTVNHYNAAGKEFAKIDRDVVRVTGASPGIEVEAVARPQLAAE